MSKAKRAGGRAKTARKVARNVRLAQHDGARSARGSRSEDGGFYVGPPDRVTVECTMIIKGVEVRYGKAYNGFITLRNPEELPPHVVNAFIERTIAKGKGRVDRIGKRKAARIRNMAGVEAGESLLRRNQLPTVSGPRPMFG